MRSEIVQRGEDFSVQQNVFSRLGPNGTQVFTTNRFTLLENGLNYFDGTLVGFSGSRSNERIGAFYSGRRSSGTTPSFPVLLQAGRDFCNPNSSGRWGDYSYTTLDPSTGKFWTIQEYAEKREGIVSIWGTSITCIKPF